MTGTALTMEMVNRVAGMVQSEQLIIREGAASSPTTAAADRQAENAAGRIIMQDLAATPHSRDLYLWVLDLMAEVVMQNSHNRMNSRVSVITTQDVASFFFMPHRGLLLLSLQALSIVFAPTLCNEGDLLSAAGYDMTEQLGESGFDVLRLMRLASNVCKFVNMCLNWRLRTHHGFVKYYIIR